MIFFSLMRIRLIGSFHLFLLSYSRRITRAFPASLAGEEYRCYYIEPTKSCQDAEHGKAQIARFSRKMRHCG